MRLRWSSLLFVSVMACGDNAPPVPDGPPLTLTNGSRLHAAWFATADGQKVAPVAGGWFDTELGIPCHLARADDGVTRCIPDAEGVGQFAGALQFSDAACTVPAVFQNESPDLRRAARPTRSPRAGRRCPRQPVRRASRTTRSRA